MWIKNTFLYNHNEVTSNTKFNVHNSLAKKGIIERCYPLSNLTACYSSNYYGIKDDKLIVLYYANVCVESV